MSAILHRAAAALNTLNIATLRLLFDNPRKAIAYGREQQRSFVDHMEMPIERIMEADLLDLFPAAAEATITLRSPWYHEGNVSDTELVMLCLMAKVTNAQKVFEIGTFNGRTIANLAGNCSPSAKLYTLDLPPGEPEATQWQLDDRERRWAPELALLCDVSNVTPLFGDSARFDFSPYDEAIDFFFVDGSHAYEYVQSDTAKALECARSGGVIVWHDYGQWSGVTRYINEIAKERDLHWMRGTTLVVEKRPTRS